MGVFEARRMACRRPQVCRKLKQEGYTVVGTVRSRSAELEAAGVECVTGWELLLIED